MKARWDTYGIAKIHIDEIKKSFSPEPLGQIQPNSAHSITGWREFMFSQIEGIALFQGEIIIK